jgi:hypothetical protein
MLILATPMGFFEGLVIAIFSIIAAAAIARGSHRDPWGWAMLAFLFGPLAPILALCMPALSAPAGAAAAEAELSLELRDCPKCAEPIKRAAIKCKHCGSDVDALPPPPAAPPPLITPSKKAEPLPPGWTRVK